MTDRPGFSPYRTDATRIARPYYPDIGAAHVKAWERHLWRLEAPLRLAAVDELVRQINAEYRARVNAGARDFCDGLARMHRAFVASKQAAE